MLVPTPARVVALAAVAAAFCCSSASAAISAATPIDGPSADLLGVDGVAMSEDGTGGLVYRKRVGGRVNVFVSRFTAKGWQPPQRVDVGQSFNSSFPAIGAGDDGRLVVTWVHEFGGSVQNRMYSAVLGPGASRFQAPVALDLDVREGLDAAPSLSMNRGGVAYLTYRVVLDRSNPNLPPGTIDADIRLARFQGSYWSVLGQPVDRNAAQPMRKPTATNGPQVATDANGNAVVAWSEPDDELVDRVYVRRIFGQTPGLVLQASPSTDPGAAGRPLRAGPDQFDLDVSPFGEAAVAFRQLPASGSSFTRPRAYVNLLPSVFAEGAKAFLGARAVDTGGVDAPPAALGPVSVGVDDEGGFDVGLGLGSSALAVRGDESKLDTPIRLDDGSTGGAPDPIVDRSPDGALAAAYELSVDGAGGVGLLERRFGGSFARDVISSERGGAVQLLQAAGSGLGDLLVGLMQGEGAETTITAGSIDAPPGAFSASTPPDWVNTPSIKLGWDAAPAGIGRVTYELTVDEEAVGPKLRGLTSTVRASVVGDGDHDVVVLATDEKGQVTATPASSLKVDRTAPKVAVRVNRAGRRVTVQVSDGPKGRVSGVSSSDTELTWGDGKSASGRRSFVHRYARRGSFRITLKSRDKAGNKTTVQRTVRVG